MPQPAPVGRTADELIRVYIDAWQRITAETERILNDPSRANRRRRLNELRQAVERELSRLNVDTRGWLQKRLPQIYQAGAESTLSIVGQGAMSWSQLHVDAVQRLAIDTFDDLLRATEFVRADVKRFIRDAAKLTSERTLTTGQTVRQGARSLRRELQDRGLAAVVYRDGSRHGLAEYAETVLRTKCLPGDAVVTGARASAIYRRWYEGEWVEVTTRSGRKLSGTPNHPVLTNRGWVGLGDLSHGQHLICHGLSVEQARAAADNHVAHPPATLAEVFDALAAVVVPERERTRQPDFHGDGRDGYVDVLRPDRVLRVGALTAVDERSVKDVLTPADVHHVVGACLGAPFPRDLPLAQRMRLGRGPGGMAGRFYDAADCSDIELELLGQLRGGLAAEVASHDLLAGKILSVAGVVATSVQDVPRLGQAPCDACVLEHTPYDIRAEPGFIGDTPDAEAGSIEVDDVAFVLRRSSWAGHVYNLTTVDGYFAANGVYTGNTAVAYNEGAINGGIEHGFTVFEIFDGPGCGLEAHGVGDEANGMIVSADTAMAWPIAHPRCQRAFAARPDLQQAPARAVSGAGSVSTAVPVARSPRAARAARQPRQRRQRRQQRPR